MKSYIDQGIFLSKQKMVTLLGTSFSTDENAMAQADV